ncbi:MAG: MaoC family dehydratase N-terminal domain-containing protein [Actinobacteria bacterium]|nr:MaoC family dehydratase N-terminal domain-containing protein [Actinomycetota bacterium]
MELNRELVGKRYERPGYRVTAEAIERYARATNDANPAYFGPSALASPVFPVVAGFPTFMDAARDPELGADVVRLVHASEEHVLRRPLRPGDVVSVTSEMESIEVEDAGESFTARADLEDADGELVAQVRGKMLIRGMTRRRRARSAPGEPSEALEILAEETTAIDEDQTYRYADASGDDNPIHVDEEAAKRARLPGVILHGMCTMAVATKAAVNTIASGDPARIARVDVDFSKPVFPGQTLTTKIYEPSGGGYGFDVVNQNGITVIKGGRVELHF